MADSKTEIANLALKCVGVSVTLAALETDRRDEAVHLRACYPTARDAVLADGEWPWAERAKSLALIGEHTKWAYLYAYPADCIHARSIWPGVRNPSADDSIPFGIVSLVNVETDQIVGRAIGCDATEPVLLYTARIDLPALYPPKFVLALAWKLGSLLIAAIKKDEKAGDRAEQRYRMALAEALAESFNEGAADKKPKARLIRTRSL